MKKSEISIKSISCKNDTVKNQSIFLLKITCQFNMLCSFRGGGEQLQKKLYNSNS
jgi:hypothetical protein